MKVLLIYVLYYENNKNSIDHKDSLRRTFLNAFGDNPDYTLEVVNLGNETGNIKNGKELNDYLQKNNFDIAIVSEEGDWVVTLETAKKLGKKLFLMHWDTWLSMSPNIDVNFKIAYKTARKWAAINQPLSMRELADYCNILVTDYGYGEIFPNVYGIYYAEDTKFFNNEEIHERDIDVSHLGALYTPERHKYAQIFQKANLKINYAGSMNKNIFPAQVLSLEDYAKVYKKSKISLGFNGSIFGENHRHRNGKIVQAGHCNSFFLTSYPEVYKSPNGTWFTEGIHFDSINLDNCVDKIRYYLNNPEICKKIANALNEEIRKNHSNKHLWENIFSFAKDK